jgi:hypothetical protein
MKLYELSNTNEDVLLHEEVINLWEMANISSKSTGIDGIIVWVNGGGSKLQHGPRIKVCRGLKWNPAETSTIPLTGKPRVIGNADVTQDEFAQIVQWINLNKAAIISYSNDEITTDELFTLLKKI